MERAGAARANTVRSRGGCWWKPNGLRGSVRRRDGAFESRSETRSRNIILAGDSEQTGPQDRDHPAPHRPPASFSRPPSCPPPEGPVIRDVIEQAIGHSGLVWHRPASSAKGPVPLHREGASKVFAEALRSEVDRCSGVSTAQNCGFAPMNRCQSRRSGPGATATCPR